MGSCDAPALRVTGVFAPTGFGVIVSAATGGPFTRTGTLTTPLPAGLATVRVTGHGGLRAGMAWAGGVRPAVERARAGVGHLVKIELEVDTLAQLEEALTLGVDAVLLDNMGPDMLRQAVGMVDGRAITEASGRIRPDTAPAIAASGVDLLSVGWLTHSATLLNIGLDWLE